MRGLVPWLLFLVPCHASSQEVGLQQFIRQLSQQQGFEVNGAELLGNTSIVLPDRNAETEVLISRVLRQYNHVVKYADGEISSIVIFGRKGNDVGALPETYQDPDPVEEN